MVKFLKSKKAAAKGGSVFKGGTPKGDRKIKAIPLAERGERGLGLKFSVEIYQTVSSFQPGTKIQYVSNPKTPGSKSFTRYAKYEKSKTVGESLKNGSKLADLCWELDRGYYKVLGGVRSDVQEKQAIGEKAFAKAQRMLKSFQGPRGLNVKLDNPQAAEALKKEEEWRENKLKRVKEMAKTHNIKIENEAELTKLGIHEAQELHGERKVCDAMCEKWLKEAAKARRKISDKELKESLSLWGFAQNRGRLNVMREGIKYVYSDTIGAIKRRCLGYGLTPATRHYPNFVKLLCTWLNDNRLELKLGCDFKCSAINLNANYAGARHRDVGNEGPSAIRAVGDFEGGKLMYWPHDTARPKTDLKKLSEDDAMVHDLKNNTTIFDGTRAHEVQDFTGNRYSIVYFTASGYRKIKPDDVKYLKGLNMPWPTPQAMDELKKATTRLIEGKASMSSAKKVKKVALKKAAKGGA